MEYEILGISEFSSTEEAQKALNRIRLENHLDEISPSEKERATIILKQAESAYKRIKDKTKMNDMIKNFLSSRSGIRILPTNDKFIETGFHMGPQFGCFGMSNFHNTDNSNGTDDRKSFQTSYYSYENYNGKVTESGNINGISMTENELKKYRIGNNFKVHKHIE